MKVKKILSMMSAIIITLSTAIGCFPSFKAGKQAIRAYSADTCSPDIIIDTLPINSVKKNSDDIKKTSDGFEYYEEEDGIVICGYSGKAQDIVVPEKIDGKAVISITDRAFSGNNIRSLELGKVQNLGYRFVENCESIIEITIPKTVTDAFGALQGSCIETVTFEEGMTNVPDYICSNADSVKNIILPDTIESIGGYAFEGTSISSVTIPENATELGKQAFNNCDLLTEIVIPDNATSIEDSCFGDCKNLKKISFGKSITTLGYRFLENCEGITELTIPKTVKDAFGALQGSCIETVTFEEGMANIPDYICSNADSVKNIILPDTIESIGGYAFEGTSISSVTIPENTTGLGEQAFNNCDLLTEIVIPDNVTSIGDGCFGDCKNLKKISFGKSVTTLGYRFLENCEGITELTIPKTVKDAFGALQGSCIETVTFEEGMANIPDYICSNADSVKNIILPDTIESIGGYAFEGTSISSVTIPENTTGLGKQAFYNCDLLTEIVIPDNVTSIGDSCFGDCKNLKKISFGKSITTLGYRFLENCEGITEITIPKTVTKAYGALQGSCVDTVTFEEGMNEIPDYFCSDNSALKRVVLPSSVSMLNDYAFANCTLLLSIIGGSNNIKFKPHTFENCESLFDNRFTLLDPSSYLSSNADLTSVNGMVNYTVRYQLQDSIASSSQNHQVSIEIPEGMVIIPESISSNVIDEENTDMTSGIFIVTKPKGIIKFSCRILEYGDYTIAARLSFDYNDEWWTETIGTLDVDVPKITCSSIGTTNNYSIDVHGIAEKGADVAIYVDDKKASSVKANEYTGKYSTTLTLPEKESGSTYNIYAESNSIISDDITVTYESNKPAIKSVWLVYNDHEDEKLDITDVFTKGTSPVISYNPAYPMIFEIEADHNEQIFSMYVTSTKGKDTKYLEAKWDDERNIWATDGLFDPTDPNYIPGSLNISTVQYNDISASSNHEIRISSEVKENSSVEIIDESDERIHTQLTLSNGDETFKTDVVMLSGSKAFIPYNVSPQLIYNNPKKYGYTVVDSKTNLDGTKESYYMKTITEAPEFYNEVFTTTHDLTTGIVFLKYFENSISDGLGDSLECEIINYCVNKEKEELIEEFFKANGVHETFESLEEVGKIFKCLYDTNDLLYDYQKANGNEEYIIAASLLYLAKMVNTLGIEYTHPVAGIIIDITTTILDRYLDYCMETGQPFFSWKSFIRFIIDPSGYVFEAIDSNRIKDAKLTIYYKDPESGETILWNAEDYDQSSTLYSASDGSYAWDVPEGLWKVVCEKEGYETIESEWLNVPPVQTGINFSLVSKEVPELVSAEMSDNGIVIKFSRFMDTSTVNTDTLSLDGVSEKYSIAPQLNNAGDKYADTFIVTGKFENSVKSISISDKVLSYSGSAAKQGSVAITGISDSICLGDVNSDGIVDSSDASEVLMIYAQVSTGGGSIPDETKAVADINGDGLVDSSDASMILEYYAYVSTGGSDSTDVFFAKAA